MADLFIKVGIYAFVIGVTLLIILAFLHNTVIGGASLACAGVVALTIGGIMKDTD